MIGTALAAAPGPPQTPLKFPLLPKQSSQGWYPSPALILPPGSTDYERLAKREANHHHYQQHGNHKTWYYYVTFGFYHYDDVDTFINAWKKPIDDDDNIDLARFKIIWTEFHFHRMNDMQPNTLLEQWAVNYATPYLNRYNKDFIFATNVDYDEHRKQTTTTNIRTEGSVWTEINRNSRRGKTSTSPSPPSSPRTHPSQPSTDTYYSPLQEPDEDTDVIMLDANDHTTQANSNPTNTTDITQPTPKSGNTKQMKSTYPHKPLQLRNAYKRKTHPVNKSFARQLKHFMDARNPPDRDPDGNNSLSSASSTENTLPSQKIPDSNDSPAAPVHNPYKNKKRTNYTG